MENENRSFGFLFCVIQRILQRLTAIISYQFKHYHQYRQPAVAEAIAKIFNQNCLMPYPSIH